MEGLLVARRPGQAAHVDLQEAAAAILAVGHEGATADLPAHDATVLAQLIDRRVEPDQHERTAERGVVRWQIRGGALVSHRQDRRGGFLQIDVRRLPDPDPDYQAIHVEIAVLSFYPAIANAISPRLYAATQSAIHVLVTHGFLRSLARLDLAESRTGRFRGQGGGAQ